MLAVFYKADYESVINMSQLRGELVLAIDSVQDTGNLGTIVRIADWYGIGHIVCSMRAGFCCVVTRAGLEPATQRL